MRKYLFVSLLFLSCASDNGNAVAIRDFKPSLQPWLVKAAATGIVGYDTATRYIRTHATDKELVLLSRSEQPILRAIALEEMMDRPSFDPFKVIMDHLADTAMIAMDAGEWGFQPMTVSDFLVEHRGKWKTEAQRAITTDSILLHHDYLWAAYLALPYVTRSVAYYSHIRKMAQRDGDYEEIEYALYALAGYKKKEDIPLIKEIIERDHGWHMTGTTFNLMKTYPDTSYLDILEEEFPRRFYRNACSTGLSWANEYIAALGSYKNDSCAAILKIMFEHKPFMPCRVDTATLRRSIVHAIWDNPCPAFARLRAETAALKGYDDYKDTAGVLTMDLPFQPDTTTRREPVRWW